MLQQSILKHPYFNEELNEVSAKEYLKKSTEGNFLFCKGAKENEIVLLYKAFYIEELKKFEFSNSIVIAQVGYLVQA